MALFFWMVVFFPCAGDPRCGPRPHPISLDTQLREGMIPPQSIEEVQGVRSFDEVSPLRATQG